MKRSVSDPAQRRPDFALRRAIRLLVKSDGQGGFMAIAGAGGFNTADDAKRWIDQLAALMVDVDATHRGTQSCN